MKQLPDFPYDSSPCADRCERCAADESGDLRFMILRGRTRYLGRTLCEVCAETLLEVMIGASVET